MIKAVIVCVLSVCAFVVLVGILAARNPSFHGYDPDKHQRDPDPARVIVQVKQAAPRQPRKKPLTMTEQLAKDNEARHKSRAERYHNGVHYY